MMSLDPNSQLSYRFAGDKQEGLLTALGNLIGNAMEAVKGTADTEREIMIFLTDIGDDVVIEIDDSGSGIPKAYAAHIFDQGFSTKEKANRGTGLALSQHMLREVGGDIMLEDTELGGACFVMMIPKDGGQQHE